MGFFRWDTRMDNGDYKSLERVPSPGTGDRHQCIIPEALIQQNAGEALSKFPLWTQRGIHRNTRGGYTRFRIYLLCVLRRTCTKHELL